MTFLTTEPAGGYLSHFEKQENTYIHTYYFYFQFHLLTIASITHLWLPEKKVLAVPGRHGSRLMTHFVLLGVET